MCDILVSFWWTFVKPGVDRISTPTISATVPGPPENFPSPKPVSLPNISSAIRKS